MSNKSCMCVIDCILCFNFSIIVPNVTNPNLLPKYVAVSFLPLPWIMLSLRLSQFQFFCIVSVAIGSLAQLVQILLEANALEYSILVAATAFYEFS